MGSSQSQPMRLREALPLLSDKLVPSEEYYRSGNMAANNIFNILRQNRNDVDRVIIGGSMGKRTAISTENVPEAGRTTPPDFDIVVFLNNNEPPFRKVLDEFADAFRNARGHNILIKNCSDQHFVCIEYQGFKIDVSPAPNLRNGYVQNLLELRVGDTQQAKTMEIIEKAPNKQNTIRAYGSGLTESAVKFVKAESPAAHALIRLAKLWNSKIQINEYVLARSYLIEIVAIHAYRQTGNNSTVDGFINFLKAMKDFRSLHINLMNVSLPRHLQMATYLVLDPINPHNNLAKQSFTVINKFSQAASLTLDKISSFQSRNGNTAAISSMNDLIELIDPNECWMMHTDESD